MVEFKRERFRLREFEERDIDPLHRKINDWEVVRYLANVPYPYKREHAVEWVEGCMDQIDENPRTRIPLVIEIDGELNGSVSLAGIIPGHKAAMGYWLDKNYWGQGIMSEAAGTLAEYGLEELGLVRVEASVYTGNLGSARVLENNGFELEGTLRNHARRLDGVITDSLMYAKTIDLEE